MGISFIDSEGFFVELPNAVKLSIQNAEGPIHFPLPKWLLLRVLWFYWLAGDRGDEIF